MCDHFALYLDRADDDGLLVYLFAPFQVGILGPSLQNLNDYCKSLPYYQV
jgi:hypothetical protein